MKRLNSKVSFVPGFFVGKKILTLGVLFCILAFFSWVYASGPGYNNASVGEHPWDENSEVDHQPPKFPAIYNVLVFPSGSFDGWIIVGFPQVKSEGNEKSRIQINSSDKKRGSFVIFF
jgi:hypothetical protein